MKILDLDQLPNSVFFFNKLYFIYVNKKYSYNPFQSCLQSLANAFSYYIICILRIVIKDKSSYIQMMIRILHDKYKYCF